MWIVRLSKSGEIRTDSAYIQRPMGKLILLPAMLIYLQYSETYIHISTYEEVKMQIKDLIEIIKKMGYPAEFGRLILYAFMLAYC